MTEQQASTSALQQRWQAVMMRSYSTPPIALASGIGCVVTDVDGRQYLDLIAGIATSSLGHAHPRVVAAVSEQAARLVHTSNLAAHEPGIALAERLAELTGLAPQVFFCQDGTGANEAAYKIARLHGRSARANEPKQEIIAAEGSFHGRTLGSLSITGSASKREPFEPLPGPVRFVPYGDAQALRDAVGPQTSAVFLEPIQGEAGVVIPPGDYLAAARAACDAHGALLVIDEVQSGMGRVGAWFASLGQGVRPDVITLAKGIAAGFPLGACLAFGSAADLLGPGDHGSTFGGNPVSCAAGLAVIDTIESDDLLSAVKRVGEHLRGRLADVDHPLLEGARGLGLLQALQLSRPVAREFEHAARAAGFLVNAVRPDAIRLAPPLILTEDQADAFADALPGILDSAAAGAT